MNSNVAHSTSLPLGQSIDETGHQLQLVQPDKPNEIAAPLNEESRALQLKLDELKAIAFDAWGQVREFKTLSQTPIFVEADDEIADKLWRAADQVQTLLDSILH